jgi:alpha-1,3/alpha-1,6-mannosyltransferase
VLAVDWGGPTETVVDGITRFLRDPTPESFRDALLELINDLTKAATMGRAGRMHTDQTFGTQRFETEWKVMVEETHRLRQTHNNSSNNIS